MKIVLQNGESITIVVPAGTSTNARVAIQTEHMPVVTVDVRDGLIGEIKAGITDGCGLSSALRCYVLNDVMVECARWGGRPGGQDARTKVIDC